MYILKIEKLSNWVSIPKFVHLNITKHKNRWAKAVIYELSSFKYWRQASRLSKYFTKVTKQKNSEQWQSMPSWLAPFSIGNRKYNAVTLQSPDALLILDIPDHLFSHIHMHFSLSFTNAPCTYLVVC